MHVVFLIPVIFANFSANIMIPHRANIEKPTMRIIRKSKKIAMPMMTGIAIFFIE